MHETGSFSIPAMRDFVPPRLRPWMVVLFVIVFQFSGGVYLAAVSPMAGSTALMQEDILMAGYASMVGMALTFAIMFRLKFRFSPRTSLLACASALIVCNLICMYTRSVPVLVAVCFVAGFFRMWGTFECNSTIQLWLTPQRDLSVFFCFIYLLVQGCIQFSGLLTVYLSVWAKWEYMHWLVIGLLLSVRMVTMFVYRNNGGMRKFPLYGIDWLGAVLWAVLLLCILFVCVYGEHYDWYESAYIRMATVGGVVALGLNLWRASFIRHPFIALQTWGYKTVYLTFILYLVINLLLSPSHLLESIYVEAILGYDARQVVSLNWISLLGTVSGAAFVFFTFARRKWRYKTMTVIAFLSIIAYLAIFYFTIDYRLPKEALILPLFLRSFGYVIVAICFLTALSRVPFQYFFQAVALQAFVSAGFGGALGTAALNRLLSVVLRKNVMLLSSTLDHVHPAVGRLSVEQLYRAVQQQALMVSMKELYGWLVWASLFCFFLFLLTENSVRPLKTLHPRYRLIRRYVKHELRMRT